MHHYLIIQPRFADDISRVIGKPHAVSAALSVGAEMLVSGVTIAHPSLLIIPAFQIVHVEGSVRVLYHVRTILT